MGGLLTRSISAFRRQELREAVEEAPIVTLYHAVLQQVFGWPMYLFRNAAGQLHYPAGTNRECERVLPSRPLARLTARL
jgi:omega-6 fatty acid desaturase (delta-12 desaturase)